MLYELRGGGLRAEEIHIFKFAFRPCLPKYNVYLIGTNACLQGLGLKTLRFSKILRLETPRFSKIFSLETPRFSKILSLETPRFRKILSLETPRFRKILSLETPRFRKSLVAYKLSRWRTSRFSKIPS